MKLKIKDLTVHSYRCFDGNWTKYEKLEAHNEAIMKTLFKGLQTGTINGFYLVSDKEFKLYHRSTKEAGAIQLSYGFYKDGELIPCGDCQLYDFSDFSREGYPAGTYQTI